MAFSREQYHSEGFYHLKGVIDKSEINRIKKEVEILFDNQLRPVNGKGKIFGNDFTLFDKMKALKEFNPDKYLATAKRCAKLLCINRLLEGSVVEEVLSSLSFVSPSIVSEPVFHICSEQLALENGYTGFDAHQDWPSIQGSLDGIVIWVPLTNVNKTNFPLELIPESHKRGFCPGDMEKHLFRTRLTHQENAAFIPIVANEGDLIVMSVWTIHRTRINGSGGFRLACSTRYDNSAEPTFIERGYPCAYSRYVKREIFEETIPELRKIHRCFES